MIYIRFDVVEWNGSFDIAIEFSQASKCRNLSSLLFICMYWYLIFLINIQNTVFEEECITFFKSIICLELFSATGWAKAKQQLGQRLRLILACG